MAWDGRTLKTMLFYPHAHVAQISLHRWSVLRTVKRSPMRKKKSMSEKFTAKAHF